MIIVLNNKFRFLRSQCCLTFLRTIFYALFITDGTDARSARQHQMQQTTHIRDAAAMLAQAKHAVCFSGAGMSAESGIPTFRGDDGIWKKHPPALFGNLPGLTLTFLVHPDMLRRFIVEALDAFVSAEPNPGHDALADLEQEGLLRAIITQNIDDLHEDAGSETVLHLHGDIRVFRCTECGHRTRVSAERLGHGLVLMQAPHLGRLGLLRALNRIAKRCPKCNGRTRPDIVFFGESLSRTVMQAAHRHAETCDVMLVIGASGLVYPAAEIPVLAARNGAALIEINPEQSPLTQLASLRISGNVADVLPELAQQAMGLSTE